MSFDLSTQENRNSFRSKIVASDPIAIGFVETLATRLSIHTYDRNSPGLFVQRNDVENEPGTIVGICGGRRFLVNDADIAWMVWQWQRLAISDLVFDAKSRRALALLVIADDTYKGHNEDTIVLQNDSSIEGQAMATRTIIRMLKLREEQGRTQGMLDACYETIHAARKELGLSLRESSHIPNAIRVLKRKAK